MNEAVDKNDLPEGRRAEGAKDGGKSGGTSSGDGDGVKRGLGEAVKAGEVVVKGIRDGVTAVICTATVWACVWV